MAKSAKEKDLKLLETSYLMYERTKNETYSELAKKIDENGDRKYSEEDIEEKVGIIQNAQDDIIGKYAALGGSVEHLKELAKQANIKKKKTNSNDKVKDNRNLIDKVLADFENSAEMTSKKRSKEELDEEVYEQLNGETVSSDFVPRNVMPTQDTTYDIIPLPSNGECYKNKLGKVPVAYLTAYDENMILSPNLYNNKLIIDYILKEKILNNEIDPDDMLEGDREAIILYLRASGYGNEYPITATDQETGTKFESYVDLSQLKYKPFKLKGDANGWFSYTLPVSKKEVKFKFLTHRDIVKLKKASEREVNMLRKNAMIDMVTTLDSFIESDNSLDRSEKIAYKQAIRTIEDWKNSIPDEDATPYTHTITNTLELEVMSIDGVTDRKMIRNFVQNMKAMDSYSLRKYIQENEPGIDYHFTVKKPESLGGGSQEVFLQFDEYIFLNISDRI